MKMVFYRTIPISENEATKMFEKLLLYIEYFLDHRKKDGSISRKLFFFFFGSVKSREYIEENELKAPKEYTRGVQKGEYLHPHLYPIQVKKSTKELKLSSLNNLAQDHKVNKKYDF